MHPSERRDVRQELRENAESVALALRDSIAEVKRVLANDDGGKEVQAGYAEMPALQCHLALSRNRPEKRRSARSVEEKSAGVVVRGAGGAAPAEASMGSRSGNMEGECTPIQVVHKGRYVASLECLDEARSDEDG